MQIVINAGGTGTRLWPISTKNVPKQFVDLFDNQTLLSKTYNRLRQSFNPEQIWVNVNQSHYNTARQILPGEFADSHILTEPEKRDTFAAVVAHSAVVSHFAGVDEPIIFLNSDHLILPEEIATQKQNQALKIINHSLLHNEFDIVVIGIQPTFPATQYGYIQIRPEDKDQYLTKVVPVLSFKEKPNQETAEEFLRKGNYLWNFGSFSFCFSKLETILAGLYPEILPAVKNIHSAGQIDLENFRQLPKIAFDYAVLEKIGNLGVIGINFEVWEDIGTWEILAQYLPDLDQFQNHKQFAGSGNKVKTIYPHKKIAFVGVSNLLFVETEEGILIADPKYTNEIRKVTEWSEQLTDSFSQNSTN